MALQPCIPSLLCNTRGEDGAYYASPCCFAASVGRMGVAGMEKTMHGFAAVHPLAALQHPWGGQGRWHGEDDVWLCKLCKEDEGCGMPEIMHPPAACSTHGAYESRGMEEAMHLLAALQPLQGG